MNMPMNLSVKKIVIDCSCCLSVGFMILYLMIFTEPSERGFFCNDESIRYPYKASTISTTLVTFLAFMIPVFGMLLGEYLHEYKSKKKLTPESREQKIYTWVFQVYQKVGLFLFGGLITILMTETAKQSIGRLRPHFIDVCQPNIDCQNGSYEIQHNYHINFKCENNNTKNLWEDSRKSFLSGHSSCIMYGMIYFSLYLELRMTWKGSKLLKYLLQVICLWTSWFVVMSRISDNMHHWSDVLAGMLLGSIVSLINAFCVADIFKEKQSVDENHDEGSSTQSFTSTYNRNTTIDDSI